MLPYQFLLKEFLSFQSLKNFLSISDKNVIAKDFAFGIIRALLPETDAPDYELLSAIKNAEKGTVNYTDFSKGLVEGATGLISDINADAVVDGLKQAVSSKVDTEKVNEVSDKAQTAATNISQTATSIMEVINLFQK